MTKEKENAQLSDMIEQAQKKGINLIPIIEFFTTWYEPNYSYKIIDEIEHNYMISFLTDEDNFNFADEMRGHMVFLRMMKTAFPGMAEIKVNN